jgi:hypothetical protein
MAIALNDSAVSLLGPLIAYGNCSEQDNRVAPALVSSGVSAPPAEQAAVCGAYIGE